MDPDLEALARARVGEEIARKYRLQRLLGCGGMAAVFEAVHLRNGNRVAVKILHAHLSIGELKQRFLREGYVANAVDHPGVVRVIDDETTEDGSACLVMELLEGESLDDRWTRSGCRVPVREVCTVAYDLLGVLAAAHGKGIIHRDIKPGNLFVTRDGDLKVLDFGIARLAEASGDPGVLTRTGHTMGTPAFMPPEQALGRSTEIDGRTDLWAVGATMFALLVGEFVHAADTTQAMVVHAGSRPARSVRTVAPDLHPALAAVVDRALAFARNERWESATVMREELARAYAEAFGQALARTSRPHGAVHPWLATTTPQPAPAPRR